MNLHPKLQQKIDRQIAASAEIVQVAREAWIAEVRNRAWREAALVRIAITCGRCERGLAWSGIDWTHEAGESPEESLGGSLCADGKGIVRVNYRLRRTEP